MQNKETRLDGNCVHCTMWCWNSKFAMGKFSISS